ncbi:MAG: (d)CMP kinase [Pygmaiobacter massiliensis]|nr:(d)CMP kinase [Pygmaiobacter massiliensis]
MISIAIDGPSGAGKSSLARSLAQKLGYVYVDTGALYRTIGLAVLLAGHDPGCPDQVLAQLDKLHLDLCYQNGTQHVLLNGQDVSDQIRTEQVSKAASQVSALPQVRDFLTETQRRMAREQNVIMDGRDIGTVILPHADIKIFLTATSAERARRRTAELLEKGQQVTYEQVLEDLKQRDYQDTHRQVAPLRQAPDAILVDTSELDFDGALARLEQIIREGLR